ncbi:MAG: hypothetical protein IJ347_01185 [Faecalibacterium sp.]|nr:hypothetical protein [Faecalibacterium sp.]
MATVERAIPVGGAALNFTVVGGTTAPANPKENTIWVNTDVEVTGWAFAAEAPDDLAAGGVWIKTGSASTTRFNAMKKNTIVACPLSCMQWNGSAWVTCEAKIYQSGVWVDVQYMVIFADGQNNFGGVTNLNLQLLNDSLYLSPQYWGYEQGGDFYTTEPININGINTIRVTATAYGLGSYASSGYGVGTTPNTKNLASRSMANGVTTLDVSGISGEVYFTFSIRGGNTAGHTYVTVTKIEML